MDYKSVRIQEVKKSISHQRLIKYRLSNKESYSTLLERYFWNIALSECFYPILHNYEVIIRNHFYESIANQYGENWIIDKKTREKILHYDEQKKVINILEKLKKEPFTITVNHIISSLSLGFWTHLSYAKYEKQGLYPLLFRDKNFMPQLPRSLRTRKTLSNNFSEINKLRNLIFHHEPICHDKELDLKHKKVIEIIGWISPTISKTVELLSRYPKIKQEKSYYIEIIEKELDLIPHQNL